ncbi:hypothetical protein PT273_09530, partial [Orbaceae bacterium ESL0727]|nr:hypothetical protein [Orbaceae bacterium ESL0727]
MQNIMLLLKKTVFEKNRRNKRLCNTWVFQPRLYLKRLLSTLLLIKRLINKLLIGNRFLRKTAVIIFITTDKLSYQVIKPTLTGDMIDQEGEIALFMNTVSASHDNKAIEIALTQLFDRLSDPMTNQSLIIKRTIFKIEILPTAVQQQLLRLPTTQLSTNEVTLFVEAAIYKLFSLPATEVAFDYYHHQDDNQQLTVAICHKNDIDSW